MLKVSEADVRHILPFSKAIDLVREAYVKLARGEATNPERTLLQVPNGSSMYFMPAYVGGQPNVVIKIARVNSENSRLSIPTVLSTIYAYDSTTGVLTAEVQGDWLTAVRTAASTAVATDLLAKKKVSVLGVYGSGVLARAHVPALRLVRDFDRVLVHSKNKSRREEFAEDVSQETGVNVEATGSSNEVAEQSDVIVTATSSETPVLDGRLVKPGAHVNAVGRSSPEARELDTALVKRSKLV